MYLFYFGSFGQGTFTLNHVQHYCSRALGDFGVCGYNSYRFGHLRPSVDKRAYFHEIRQVQLKGSVVAQWQLL